MALFFRIPCVSLTGRVSYGEWRQTFGDAGKHFLQKEEHPTRILAHFPQQTHTTGPPASDGFGQRAG